MTSTVYRFSVKSSVTMILLPVVRVAVTPFGLTLLVEAVHRMKSILSAATHRGGWGKVEE
jgi:hypothetical protein